MANFNDTPDAWEVRQLSCYLVHVTKNIEIIGVTGTKGKTSTCDYIFQLLIAQGVNAAVSSSEGIRIGMNQFEPWRTLRDLWYLFDLLVELQVELLVIELTSKSLSWNLHTALNLNGMVLTNIGHDHLHQHGGMRNYVAVKNRPFRQLGRGDDKRNCFAVLNADDASFEHFNNSVAKTTTVFSYGSTSKQPGLAHVWFDAFSDSLDGSSFLVHGAVRHRCKTRLHGFFNAINVVAAVACVAATGRNSIRALDDASALMPVPGRFDILPRQSDDEPMVIVDYAHTPESLESSLSAVRALCPSGRIHLVFGCGGDRYKGKRRMMGRIAVRDADDVILTTDNSRSENPAAIVNDIRFGIGPLGGYNVIVELDRQKAIDLAVGKARAIDAVLVLGKGAERTLEARDETRTFCDMEIAGNALTNRNRRSTSRAEIEGSQQ